MSKVLYQADGRLGRITLNRPAAMNALGREAPGLAAETRRLATVFDGVTRRSPEGLAFTRRAEEGRWKQAVDERDRGVYDWTEDRPINWGR